MHVLADALVLRVNSAGGCSPMLLRLRSVRCRWLSARTRIFIGELRRVRGPSVFRPTRTKSISIFIWLNNSEPVTNCASQNYSAWSRSIRGVRDCGLGLYAEPNMGRRSDGRLQILSRRVADSLSNFGQGSYW